MRRRNGEHGFLGDEQMARELGQTGRPVIDEADVDGVGPQQVALHERGLLQKLELHRGKLAAEVVDDPWQHGMVDRRVDKSDTEAAGLALTDIAGTLRRLVHLAEQRGRFVKEGPARGRQSHSAGESLEERRANFVLQFTDLFAQRGLDNRQALSGPAEVFELGGGDEIAEVAQFHGR